jgi:hypothetical protein
MSLVRSKYVELLNKAIVGIFNRNKTLQWIKANDTEEAFSRNIVFPIENLLMHSGLKIDDLKPADFMTYMSVYVKIKAHRDVSVIKMNEIPKTKENLNRFFAEMRVFVINMLSEIPTVDATPELINEIANLAISDDHSALIAQLKVFEEKIV